MSKDFEKCGRVDTDKKDKDNAFGLAEQLHRQYADADSSKSGNLIATVGALFAIFAGYGYVFMNYPCKADALTLFGATVLTVFVLFLLMNIAAFHGYALRRDQVIVYRIRKKYMKESGIFNFANNAESAYNPIRKIMNGEDILPDYYNILYITFSRLTYWVIGATTARFVYSLCVYRKCICCRKCICWCDHCLCDCCFSFGLCIITMIAAFAAIWKIHEIRKQKEKEYCGKLKKMLTKAEKAEAEK